MPEWVSEFHLLRPWWLLALPIGVALAVLWARRSPMVSGWARLIAPSLLPYLTRSTSQGHSRRRSAWLLGSVWLLACIGLAGPTAAQFPQPMQRDTSALVVLFDLSPSMRTRDLSPDRLTRARLKVIDFLRERQEGLTGLVIYADDAYVVIPMTDDANTVIHLIPDLEPEIMPRSGSHVEAALRKGIELLITGGHRTGRLLLVTDSVTTEAQQIMERLMRQFGEYRLDILGVGTAEGGPIPLPEGGFSRDGSDRMVVATLPEQRLRNLASRAGGRYATLSPDGRDLDHLLAPYRAPVVQAPLEQTSREFDLWHDLGYWFALLLLPLVLLAFRRGWVASLAVVLPLSLHTPPAQALDWQALWQRPDQRGSQALAEGDAERAKTEFRDPAWRGLAAYEAGDHAAAARYFSRDDSARGHYNRGNALAAQGAFKDALAAYDEALARQPGLAEARHNRTLAELLLRQQAQPSGEHGAGEEPVPGDPSQGDPAVPPGQHQKPPSDREFSDAPTQEPLPRGPDVALDTPPASEPLEPETDPGEPPQAPPPQAEPEPLDPTAERMEQWLRRVPDEPGGLLRRQLQREAMLRGRETPRARTLPPGVEEDRW